MSTWQSKLIRVVCNPGCCFFLKDHHSYQEGPISLVSWENHFKGRIIYMGAWFQVIASGLHNFRPAMRQNITTTEVLFCKTKRRMEKGSRHGPKWTLPSTYFSHFFNFYHLPVASKLWTHWLVNQSVRLESLWSNHSHKASSLSVMFYFHCFFGQVNTARFVREEGTIIEKMPL